MFCTRTCIYMHTHTSVRVYVYVCVRVHASSTSMPVVLSHTHHYISCHDLHLISDNFFYLVWS